MAKAPLTVDRVRAALTGPIMSIRTPFNRDGSIDFAGVRTMVDFMLKNGGKVALLTAGDSHFGCMTEQDMRDINRFVVEHVAGRVMTVTCDWEFATPLALEFTKYCRDVGSDLHMPRPADWANSATVESLVEHYATLAEVMPLMLVTNIFNQRSEKFAVDTMKQLLDRVPNMLAVKEDITNEIARKTSMLCHPKWAVFAGGGLRNHMNMHPFGCDGFMDRHMNFAPKISYDYWNAVQRNDFKGALAVMQNIELPLEDFLGGFPGGRDAAIHGLLEIYGIAGRWRRKPYYSLNDAEMEKLKAFVKQLGIL